MSETGIGVGEDTAGSEAPSPLLGKARSPQRSVRLLGILFASVDSFGMQGTLVRAGRPARQGAARPRLRHGAAGGGTWSQPTWRGQPGVFRRPSGSVGAVGRPGLGRLPGLSWPSCLLDARCPSLARERKRFWMDVAARPRGRRRGAGWSPRPRCRGRRVRPACAQPCLCRAGGAEACRLSAQTSLWSSRGARASFPLSCAGFTLFVGW